MRTVIATQEPLPEGLQLESPAIETVRGGVGEDTPRAGDGDDPVDGDAGEAETEPRNALRCGAGRDRYASGLNDVVAEDCEKDLGCLEWADF